MPKKILITDDDRDLVEVLALQFANDGYTVLRAYNGDECIDTARAECPDLIIMDVTMPKLDGYSTVKMFKTDPKIKNIPIIMLTGKDQMEDLFKMEGIKDYLVKPLDYESIAQKVKSILQSKQ